jgi:osmoprotectant transport system ATP-binding protein
MVADQTGAQRANSPPILTAEGVTKRFGGVTALAGVSLTVESGECVALVGESGSGKTTLLRCFNRMVEPDAGSIRLDGRDVRELDPVVLRRGIGYVPQDGGLLPHWRVLRNAALVPELRGAAEPLVLAAESLRLVGLEPETFGARWPRDLSGGQRQRVALARALAARPGIVLLDEPFGALDAITRAELQETFGRLRSQIGITCVLVTHDINEALALADRIAVVRAGSIEQVADGHTLLAAPATPYVQHLLQRAGVRAAGGPVLRAPIA